MNHLHRTPAIDAVAPGLVTDLLRALCEESEALKRNDPAALAGAESRKQHLLRLLAPRPGPSSGDSL